MVCFRGGKISQQLCCQREEKRKSPKVNWSWNEKREREEVRVDEDQQYIYIVRVLFFFFFFLLFFLSVCFWPFLSFELLNPLFFSCSFGHFYFFSCWIIYFLFSFSFSLFFLIGKGNDYIYRSRDLNWRLHSTPGAIRGAGRNSHINPIESINQGQERTQIGETNTEPNHRT